MSQRNATDKPASATKPPSWAF